MAVHTLLVAIGAASAVATGVICSSARKLAAVTKLMDAPDGNRRFHDTATPLVGGLAVLVPVFVGSLVSVVYLAHQAFVLSAIIAAVFMMLVGVLDDRLDVSAGWRFVALTYIAMVAFSVEPLFILHTLRFQYWHLDISVPLDPLASPITALMILGFVNAVNMADGMNGQLLGSVLLWSAFIVHRMGIADGLPFFLMICSAATALLFNLRGKLFCGSAGAYAMALFVALGAIVNYRNAHGAMHADTPVFWFWLPVADCLRLLFERVRIGQPPDVGDRKHIHHLLLDRLRTAPALVVYLLLLGLPGALGEIDEKWGKLGLLFCGTVYAALIIRSYRLRQQARNTPAVVTDALLSTNGASEPGEARAGGRLSRTGLLSRMMATRLFGSEP